MRLNNIIVRPVLKTEESQFKKRMQEDHYLGFAPKIGETLWYIATHDDQWVALLGFSVSALKCKVRDEWIGWSHRNQFGRLKLVVNNNRFLILPGFHAKNLASRVISLCLKRLNTDWRLRFDHPIVLVETFVDPIHFQGTLYKASNWKYLGFTKGFRRNKKIYTPKSSSKMMFVKELHKDARKILSQPILDESYRTGAAKMTITAGHMRSLPDFFKSIPDPRRAQAQRHRLSTVLALATGAILCGMDGYKAISDWVKHLGHDARARFDCYYHKGHYTVPGESTIRRVLISVDPDELEKALQNWNNTYGEQDESLAIDGKVMCNAIDENGNQTHILGLFGHHTQISYGKKKLEPSRKMMTRMKLSKPMK